MLTDINNLLGIQPELRSYLSELASSIQDPQEASGLPNFYVNVADYGATGLSTTAVDTAFANAITALINKVVANPVTPNDGNYRGRAVLYIPAGVYVINNKEAFMIATRTARTVGIRFEGAGKGLTQIWYKNTNTGEYLFYNNDAWLHVEFSGITFFGSNSNANFMKSVSSGGAQSVIFNNCQWDGTWNHLFHLEGSDTNSEMTWNDCSISGTIVKGLYADASTGSDQFVNYNFESCNVEIDSGDFIHMEKGGNINIRGGSYIHLNAVSGTTFFKLLGNTHAYGTQRFYCEGVRFEHRNSYSQLIYCEWNGGSVSFVGCDMSTSAFAVSSVVNSVFKSQNASMPLIKFLSCLLMGKHEYQYQINAWQYPHNISYESCEIIQETTAATFIVYTSLAGNDGGKPLIDFDGCRSGSGLTAASIFDCTLGYTTAMIGQMQSYYVSPKTPQGNMPYNGASLEVYLPINAIIKGLHFWLKAGDRSSGSTTWTYSVQTNEGTPTVIGSVSGGGTVTLATGFSNHQTPWFVCDSDTKRHLTLTTNAGVDQPANAMYVIIEYLA